MHDVELNDELFYIAYGVEAVANKLDNVPLVP